MDLGAMTKRPVGFLDLPKELRDEIYRYIIPTDKPFRIQVHDNRNGCGDIRIIPTNKPSKVRVHDNRRRRGGIRILERFPLVYYALPLLRSEILEMHHRQNVFRLVANHENSYNTLLAWIHRRGEVLVRNMRRVQLTYWASYPNRIPFTIQTTLTRKVDGSLETILKESGTGGTQFVQRLYCECGLAELVQEKLSRDDGTVGRACIEYIDDSTRYGQIFGLVLQFIKVVRLAEDQERAIRELPGWKRREASSDAAATCHLCGKR